MDSKGGWHSTTVAQEFEGEAQQRGRQPYLKLGPLVGLTIRIVVAAYFLGASIAVGAEAVGEIRWMTGHATVAWSLRARPLRVESGGQIYPNMVIETNGLADEANRVTLDLLGGVSLRLDNATKIWIVSSSRVFLIHGTVYVDVDSSEVAVETSLGLIVASGARFELRHKLEHDVTLGARIREGRVEYEVLGMTGDLSAGEAILVNDLGIFLQGAVSSYGPGWQWTLDAAVVPDIRGKTVGDFLVWYARELGMTLEYSGVGAIDRVAGTIFYGQVETWRPTEAASVVLAASGLRSRVRDGVLLIELIGEGGMVGPPTQEKPGRSTSDATVLGGAPFQCIIKFSETGLTCWDSNRRAPESRHRRKPF